MPWYIPDSEITKEYLFNIQSAKCRWLTALAFIVYFGIVIVCLFFLISDKYDKPQAYFYLLLLLPGINSLIILAVGRYILSGILYPYQNFIIRETLDRTNNGKFGEDFGHFLNCMVFTLKYTAGIETKPIKTSGSRSFSQQSRHNNTGSVQYDWTFTDTNENIYEVLTVQEMQNVVELLQLYSDINSKVIAHGKNTTREFAMIT